MRNRHFLKGMALVLTVCLGFGDMSMTVYASQPAAAVEEATQEQESEEVMPVEEESGANEEEAVDSEQAKEQNSEETETEAVTQPESVKGESTESVTEGESTEDATEGESVEESTEVVTEESTEEESVKETEEETIEELTEELTTEVVSEEETTEEFTEELTTEEDDLYAMEEGRVETPESDFSWNGTTITGYKGTAKNVVIPEKARAIAADAFYGNKTIESVTISKNVINIGNSAFYNCTNLRKVVIETQKLNKWVGSYTGSSSYIFTNCNIEEVEFSKEMTYIPGNLFDNAGFQGGAEIVIPEKVTEIGANAFNRAKNLSKVTFVGEKVTSIGNYAFAGVGIESIELSETLRSIGYAAFYECKGLTEIVIPKNVTDIGNSAFYNCTNLRKVVIETKKLNKWVGSYTGSSSYIFTNCNIEEVEFSKEMTYIPGNLFDNAGFQSGAAIVIPENVTEIGANAFNRAKNLSKVTFAGEKVTSIGDYAFTQVGIESIELPEALWSIGYAAFYECSGLTEIVIPKNVTNIGNSAFYNCTNLRKVVIESKKLNKWVGSNTRSSSYIFTNCNIEEVEFSKEMTYIPGNLFDNAGFQGGAEIVVPENVTEIGANAFYHAKNLSKVAFAGEKVTSIGDYAFAGVGIESIELPEALQSIGYAAFYECSGLTEIVIPKNVTNIGNSAFHNCTNLRKVVIEAQKLNKWVGSYPASSSYIFTNCNIEEVEFSKEMTYIPGNLFDNAGFQGGGAIVIPENVTEIGANAFYHAKNLSEVTFAGEKVTSIGNNAFTQVGIESIELPEALQSIGYAAFYECKGLTEIVIPKNVTYIGGDAFYKCASLEKVILESTKLSQTGIGIFYGCRIGEIKLPEGMTMIPDHFCDTATVQSIFEIVIPASVTTIGNDAFCNTYLTKVTFAGNKLTQIEDRAFENTALRVVELPNSVKSIGYRAFYSCDYLEKMVIPSSVTSIAFGAFSDDANFKVFAEKGSYAYNWAVKQGYELAEYFSINYVLNGGSMASANPTAYEKGEDLTFNPAVRPGYEFKGWYTDAKFTKPFKYTSDTTGDLTIYAKWEILTYTINFEDNGGTLTGKLPESYTAAMEVALPIPTKVGYTFTGWYTDKACTEKNKLPKIAKGSAGNLTLYAGWKENVYSIQFVANGSGVTGSQEAFTDCGYDDKITLPVCTLKRPGYQFTGWNTKADGKGTSYANKASVSKLTTANNGKITLYAIWKMEEYSITYALNGGVNSAKNPSSYTVTKAVTFVNPTREGYTFKGWHKDANCTEKITSIKKGSSGSIKIYAKWEVNKYKVQFNANGGTGKMAVLTDREYGKAFQLTGNQFTRAGYTFNGWNTTAKGTGTAYEDAKWVKDLTITNNKTITLYAQWKEITYGITYNLDGGTNHTKNPATYAVVRGITLSNPTKTGYTFKGWYTDKEFTQKITAIKKGSEKPYTLYAKWEVNKYKVQFNVNGGTGKMAALTDREYDKGFNLSANQFTRAGYTFEGWNTNAKGTGTAYSDKKWVTNLTSVNNATITLYAQWKEITYKITYNLDGGTNHTKNPATYAVVRGVTLSNPTKTGYTFKGWYTDSEYTNKITAIKKGSEKPYTLYAKWEVNKYKVQFNANGGKGKMAALTDREYDKGFNLSDNQFTRAGYTFKGWALNAKGTGEVYVNKRWVTNLTPVNNKTITLYAVWEEITYDITYNLNGGTNKSKNPAKYAVVRGVTLSNPTKTGYTFKGWYTDSEYTNKITAIKKGSEGAVTVYAKWEVNKYKVQFNANGGTGKMAVLTNCECDKVIKLPANEFNRAGYTFKGWNTNAKGTGDYYTDSINNLTPTNNKTITLYAVWEKVK